MSIFYRNSAAFIEAEAEKEDCCKDCNKDCKNAHPPACYIFIRFETSGFTEIHPTEIHYDILKEIQKSFKKENIDWRWQADNTDIHKPSNLSFARTLSLNWWGRADEEAKQKKINKYFIQPMINSELGDPYWTE